MDLLKNLFQRASGIKKKTHATMPTVLLKDLCLYLKMEVERTTPVELPCSCYIERGAPVPGDNNYYKKLYYLRHCSVYLGCLLNLKEVRDVLASLSKTESSLETLVLYLFNRYIRRRPLKGVSDQTPRVHIKCPAQSMKETKASWTKVLVDVKREWASGAETVRPAGEPSHGGTAQSVRSHVGGETQTEEGSKHLESRLGDGERMATQTDGPHAFPHTVAHGEENSPPYPFTTHANPFMGAMSTVCAWP